ncbi:MAG: endonuclease/exonuclease/phosphatase family protein, partial [Bacteroidota bacterium]
MKKTILRILKWTGIAILLIFLYVLGSILHGTATDFQPEAIIELEPSGTAVLQTVSDSNLVFANWNVGYGGLGAESDFFYDNGGFLTAKGKMVRSPKDLVDKN